MDQKVGIMCRQQYIILFCWLSWCSRYGSFVKELFCFFRRLFYVTLSDSQLDIQSSVSKFQSNFSAQIYKQKKYTFRDHIYTTRIFLIYWFFSMSGFSSPQLWCKHFEFINFYWIPQFRFRLISLYGRVSSNVMI